MVSILKKRQRGQWIVEDNSTGLFPISTMVFANKIEDLCPHRFLAGQRSKILETPRFCNTFAMGSIAILYDRKHE
jgi:hypothetical protein